MPAGFQTAIELAFAAWSAVADITFVEVIDQGENWFAVTQESGDIRLGGHAFDGPSFVLAHAWSPIFPGVAPIGDIHFDTAENWKTTGAGGGGFDIFQVAAHEIGHAIGLRHECGDDGLDTPCNVALMNPFYTESFFGPQADDIAGAQFLYGAPAIAAVPLPAGIVLLGSALALVGAFGAHRRKTASS